MSLVSAASPEELSNDDGVRAVGARAFAAWAEPYDPPSNAAELIESTVLSEEHVALLQTDWHGRRAVWATVPYAGSARAGVAARDPSNVDAWDEDETALRRTTEHIALCDTCGGKGKTECAECGGSGHDTCRTCNGASKEYGYASNGSRRLLNCPTCRGKGRTDCIACRRGIAPCRICSGEKRLQKWIAIEKSSRTETAEVPPALAAHFGWTGASNMTDLEAEGRVVLSVEKPWRLRQQDLGSLHESWLQQLTARTASPAASERVARQHLRVVSIPRLRVTYRVGSETDVIEAVGMRLRISEASRHGLLPGRASNLRLLRRFLVAAAAIALIVYFSRGVFYWSASSAAAAACFSIMLIALYGFAKDRMTSRRHVPRWFGAMLLFAAATAGLVWNASPRTSRAAQAIRNGSLDAAERELKALGDASTPSLWADLHLARIRATNSYETALAEAAKITAGLSQAAIAHALADQLIVKAATVEMHAGRPATAATILLRASPSLARSPEVIALANEIFPSLAVRSVAKQDWRAAADALRSARQFGVDVGVTQTARDLRAEALRLTTTALATADARKRLDRSIAAERLWVAWEVATGAENTPALLRVRASMARDVTFLESRRRRR